MRKGNMAVAIMGMFAMGVSAPPPQMSPLAEVLAKYKGGKGNSVHRKYRKPNKWDVMSSCGDMAQCRNRTTGEMALKRIKLSDNAQRKFESLVEAFNV
jgi:hypothetical protein